MKEIHATGSSLSALLVEANLDVIVVFGPDQLITEWNRMATLVYGKSKEAVLGKPFQEAIPTLQDDPESLEAISQALAQVKTFVPASAAFRHRSAIENHYIPLSTAEGFIGVMNTGHHVSHRLKAEAHLEALNQRLELQYRQLERTSAELSSLTRVSSHNLKEPVRQLYTTVEHLIRSEATRLSDSGRAAFRRIQSSLTRMDLLLDDMLTLTGINILEKPRDLVSLDDMHREALARLQNRIAGKGVQVTTGPLCTIRGHAEFLRLLLHHLLGSLIRFNETPDPRISVFCETVSVSRFPDVPYSERDYYRVTLADNGTWIDQSTPAEVFMFLEKLSAEKRKQAGTALVIASKIMDVHGGFIHAASSPVAGSFFHCYFPVPEM